MRRTLGRDALRGVTERRKTKWQEVTAWGDALL
jgi:hypothetical protein